MATRPERHHLIIDDLAKVLRRPSAAPTITPAEVIAIVLTTTRWKPNRILDPDDVVVKSIIDALAEAGWKIEPL
jgi:hypothetical protein